ATWVTENEGKNEAIAKQLIEIAESQTTAAPSQLMIIYEAVEKLSQTKKSSQTALRMLKQYTPAKTPEVPRPHKEIFPNTVENHLSYARFYSSIDKPEEAEHHFKRAIEMGRSVETYIIYAQYLEKEKKIEQAISMYQGALNIEPNDPVVHNNIGLLYYQRGSLEEAASHLKESLVYEHDSTTMNNLANILADLGKPKDAEALYKQSIGVNPNDSDAHNNYAMLLWNLRQPEKADEHFKKAIRLNPEDSTIRRNYIKFLTEEKRYQEVEKQYNYLRVLDPEDPEVYLNMGYSTIQGGEVGGGREVSAGRTAFSPR
ncbi:tetratricopeptide repeat protein, partial [Candidatus Bathyarchaeota archaeon]|nr:tetratricopeptide repeat protein [Candidatus Bathyarchaeota archaeon]